MHLPERSIHEGQSLGKSLGQSTALGNDPERPSALKGRQRRKLCRPFRGCRTKKLNGIFCLHVGVSAAEAKMWWAFQPLKAIAPPKMKDSALARSPIDSFIPASLEKYICRWLQQQTNARFCAARPLT